MPHYRVKLSFSSSAARPPVYLCGTFTDPAWLPQEMRATARRVHGGSSIETSIIHDYEYVLELGPGEWEYKFLVGNNEWVCDENAPKKINEFGFVNNVLVLRSDVDDCHESGSVYSTSWEIVQKESKDRPGASSPRGQSSLDNQDKQGQGSKAFTGPRKNTQLPESAGTLSGQQPSLDRVNSRSPLRIQKRSASADQVRKREASFGPSSISFQQSHDSNESPGQDRVIGDLGHRQPAADIEHVSYIMAMPREDGSPGLGHIMAYQNNQLLRLSPDYETAVPLPVDDISRTGTPFLLQERLASQAGTSALPRRSMESSEQPYLSFHNSVEDFGCRTKPTDEDVRCTSQDLSRNEGGGEQHLGSSDLIICDKNGILASNNDINGTFSADSVVDNPSGDGTVEDQQKLGSTSRVLTGNENESLPVQNNVDCFSQQGLRSLPSPEPTTKSATRVNWPRMRTYLTPSIGVSRKQQVNLIDVHENPQDHFSPGGTTSDASKLSISKLGKLWVWLKLALRKLFCLRRATK